MNDPPDPNKMSKPAIVYDKSKKLNSTSPGPKYLVITRNNGDKTLASVSPFLIKKIIDNTCGGEVDTCKKLRNGTILVKTKNITQANKLIQLCSFNHQIDVTITEHNSLNYSRGVIYSRDLIGIPEEEILAELNTLKQNVNEVSKIMRKVNDKLIETGLIIITFDQATRPTEIKIGYENAFVRPYIPLPLKCRNCLRFGHHFKACNQNKICSNCSDQYHLTTEEEVCSLTTSCINCKESNNTSTNHSPNSKVCPVFLKEKEIQSIITIEKVDKKTAHKKYNDRHPTPSTSFANVTKSTIVPLPTKQQQCSSVNITKSTPNTMSTTKVLASKRALQNYSDLSDIDLSDMDADVTSNSSHTNSDKKISILPKNTSRKAIQRLKNSLKKAKQ